MENDFYTHGTEMR